MPHGGQRYHLVAQLAGTYVGGVHLEAKNDELRLDGFYVRTRYRGLGVGSRLLELACKISALSDSRALVACVGPGNVAADRLFEKLEFRPVPITTDSGYSILARKLQPED